MFMCIFVYYHGGTNWSITSSVCRFIGLMFQPNGTSVWNLRVTEITMEGNTDPFRKILDEDMLRHSYTLLCTFSTALKCNHAYLFHSLFEQFVIRVDWSYTHTQNAWNQQFLKEQLYMCCVCVLCMYRYNIYHF